MITQDEPFDTWTLAHAFGGFVLGVLGFGLKTTLAIALGYEVLENDILREQAAELFNEYEGLHNMAADVVAAGVGWWFA